MFSLQSLSKKILVLGLFAALFLFFAFPKPQTLPLIAIANYGPHHSLNNTLLGIKAGLAEKGFTENQQIQLEISDVNFELTLIPQMLTKLKSKKPFAMVLVSTPIAQNGLNTIKDIPLVFTSVTDPSASGLGSAPSRHLSGASDKQDLTLFLQFAKLLFPTAKTVGLLYASSESNDTALVEMMVEAGEKLGIKVFAQAVDNARDIPFRLQAFKNKVDFLYVGVSGCIQAALPTIASLAEKMHLPVFNADSLAVKEGLVLGSYGVDYFQVGKNTGYILAKMLNGEKIENIPFAFPKKEDHAAFINKKSAEKFKINLATLPQHINIVE